MDEKLFAELIKSTSQAVEIVRGERKPSRTFEVSSDIVREIRKAQACRRRSLQAYSIYRLVRFETGNKDDVGQTVRPPRY